MYCAAAAASSVMTDDALQRHRADPNAPNEYVSMISSANSQSNFRQNIDAVHESTSCLSTTQRRHILEIVASVMHSSPPRNSYHNKVRDQRITRSTFHVLVPSANTKKRRDGQRRESVDEDDSIEGDSSVEGEEEIDGNGNVEKTTRIESEKEAAVPRTVVTPPKGITSSLEILENAVHQSTHTASPLPSDSFDGREPSLRDLVYGALTKYDDVGIDHIGKRWKVAQVWISRIVISVIVVSIASLCCSTVASVAEKSPTALVSIEATAVAILGVEYFARMVCTRDPLLTFVADPWNIVDLAAMVPVLFDALFGFTFKGLAVLRIIRLVRTLRLVKGQGITELFRAMRKAEKALSLLSFLLLITLFVCSAVIYILDQTEASFSETDNLWIRSDGTVSAFQSVFHTMWWTMTTLATVGYGGIDVPFATAAKFATLGVMAAGILCVSLPTVILSAAFHRAYSDRFNSLLRKTLLEKQAESLAFGRHRRTISELVGLTRRSVLDPEYHADSSPTFRIPRMKVHMMSILDRYKKKLEKEGATGMPTFFCSFVVCRWRILKAISDAKDEEAQIRADELAARRAEEASVGRGQSLSKMFRRVSQLLRRGGITVHEEANNDEQDDQREAVNQRLVPIEELEATFAPPEVCGIKLAFVPFRWIVDDVCRRRSVESSAGGDREMNKNSIGEGDSSAVAASSGEPLGEATKEDDESGDDDEDDVIVHVAKPVSATKSIFASEKVTRLQQSKSFREVAKAQDDEVRGDVLSRSSLTEKSFRSQANGYLPPSNILLSQDMLEEKQRTLQRATDSINYNIVQLRSQTMPRQGVVHYPPKLKLLCVGGTDTISAQVAPCFPPGSYTLNFTLVLDDQLYHDMQEQLAKLTYGTANVSFVQMAPIYKLKVSLALGSVAKFQQRLVAMSGPARSMPSRSTHESQRNEEELLNLLSSPSERELLEACYLSTTTFRHVQSNMVGIVVMCPSSAALKVFQQFLPLMKFSFSVSFHAPKMVQHGILDGIRFDTVFVEDGRDKLSSVWVSSTAVAAKSMRTSSVANRELERAKQSKQLSPSNADHNHIDLFGKSEDDVVSVDLSDQELEGAQHQCPPPARKTERSFQPVTLSQTSLSNGNTLVS